MYQNIANQNPLMMQYNGYTNQNPNYIPFQNNQLINNNVHVRNNLNNLIHEHKTIQQNMPQYQHQLNQHNQHNQHNLNQNPMMHMSNNKAIDKSNKRNINIIEDILKPQKIVKNDNKDVHSNYTARKKIQDRMLAKKIDIIPTNMPYKIIIKDKIVQKPVGSIEKSDFIVHKYNKEIDANIDKFNDEMVDKKNKIDKINEDIEVEFHIDNYDKHKKKYEYKESFIKVLGFEEKIYEKSKHDCIEFYRKKQKEAEEGQRLCDEILHNIHDENIIGESELPSAEPIVSATNIDLSTLFVDNTDANTSVTVPNTMANTKSNINRQSNQTIKSTQPRNPPTAQSRNPPTAQSRNPPLAQTKSQLKSQPKIQTRTRSVQRTIIDV